MKRLVINKLDVEDDDGGFHTKHLFQVEGEEAAYSSSEVNFKVYETMNKLIARDEVDAMKVISESIYFDGIKKDSKIPDSAGGNACGRTFPAWEGRAFTDEDRAKQKKIAGWYTFAFGEVTFPGKAPLLVNLRLTGRLSMPFGTVVDSLGRDKAVWPSTLINIKARPLKGKGQFADLTFTIKQTGLEVEEDTEIRTEISKFINEHNDQILNKQKAA